MRARVWLGPVLLVLLAAAPASAREEETRADDDSGLRREIESLEAHLDRAVGRVSVPHAGLLMGRADSTRGYRLPGYGILFVLAPRALPGEHGLFVLRRGPEGPRHVQAHRNPPVGDPWESEAEDPTWEPERVEEIERQVLILQHVAEAERRAAEEDMERIVRDVRIRLAAPPARTPGLGPQGAPVGARDPSAAPFPPDELELPATPPWKFWFESEEASEGRSPERVVAEVRVAVIGALESQAGRVAGLRPDEFVSVAVDFVPGGLFASHPRPERTLVVRARQRDLEACARGAMGRGELQKKVEVFEY